MAFIMTPENTIEERMFREFETAVVDSAHTKRELEPMVKMVLNYPNHSVTNILLHPTFQEEFIRLLVPFSANLRRLLNSDIYNIAYRFREIIEKHGLIYFDYSTKFKNQSMEKFEENYERLYEEKVFELNFMKQEARVELLAYFRNHNSVSKDHGKPKGQEAGNIDKQIEFIKLLEGLLTGFQLVDLFLNTFNEKTRNEGIKATSDYLQKMAEIVD